MSETAESPSIGLRARLAQFEAQIQRLVERNTARFFPLESRDSGHPEHLLTLAVESFLEAKSFEQLARSSFVVHVHPEAIDQPEAAEKLKQDMAEILEQASQASGITLQPPLKIVITQDPLVEKSEIRIEVQQLEAGLEGTQSIPALETDNGPIHAFLMSTDQEVFYLVGNVTNIGRHRDNHIVLAHVNVSRHHAQIRLINAEHTLFDLGSTRGTFVNNQRIQQHTLKAGDVLMFADTTLIYGTDQDPDQIETRPLGLSDTS
jgi:hypothetical protein